MSRYSSDSSDLDDSSKKSKKKKHRRSRSRSRERRKDRKRSRSREKKLRRSRSRDRKRSRSRDRRSRSKSKESRRDRKRSRNRRQRSFSRSKSRTPSREKSNVIVIEESTSPQPQPVTAETMLSISDQLKRARAITDIEADSFQQKDFRSTRKGDSLQIPLPNEPGHFEFGTSMEVRTKAEEDLDKLSKEGLINPKLFGDQAAREKRYLQHIWTIRQRALQKMKG